MGQKYSRPRAGTPDTVRFIRRAAPAFLRHMSQELSREILPPPFKPRPEAWPDRGTYAAWYGHSTVLLKIDGFTILTDPVFSPRVGLTIGPTTLGLKRLIAAASTVDELPKIDLILLSHAHMDHFDIPSLRQLESRETKVVTADRTSDLLRSRRYAAVHELQWNASVQVGPARITAFQVNHWGARIRSDVYRGFNGYTIELNGRRILFGGDTAFTDSFRQLRSSKLFDFAVMPIGAYDPWIHVHCNPEQALTMAYEAGAERILPVHHKTFSLSREPVNEPMERLINAVRGDTSRICLQEIGQEWRL